MQLLVDFTEGQRPVNAEFCRRGILAQTAAKPDLRRQIANPVEQNAVVMSIITFNQHQHGFRLVKAGEIPEITVLAVRVFTVRAARRFRRGKNQRGAAGLHLCQQSLTTTLEFLLRYLTHNTLLGVVVFSAESVYGLPAQSAADA